MNFDVDGYLRGSPFKTFTVYHKGELSRQGKPSWRRQDDSGFQLLVGRDEESNILDQGLKAVDFLTNHRSEFERLKRAGAEKMHLGFGIAKHHTTDSAQYLPPELLLAMGQFHIGLVFLLIDASQN